MSNITVIQIFNQSMTTSEAITHTVNLERFDVEGFFSLQIVLAGTGNVDVIWAASNDGSNFITPADTDDIFSAFGPASGPGSDGIDIASFDPLLAKFLKITATGQGAGAITSIIGSLAIQ